MAELNLALLHMRMMRGAVTGPADDETPLPRLCKGLLKNGFPCRTTVLGTGDYCLQCLKAMQRELPDPDEVPAQEVPVFVGIDLAFGPDTTASVEVELGPPLRVRRVNAGQRGSTRVNAGQRGSRALEMDDDTRLILQIMALRHGCEGAKVLLKERS